MTRPVPPSKVIDLTPCFRRARRQELAYELLARWPQYLSLAALLLYGLLRLVLYPQTPLGCYRGPLALLWPASYLLLLTSFLADRYLWQESWE